MLPHNFFLDPVVLKGATMQCLETFWGVTAGGSGMKPGTLPSMLQPTGQPATAQDYAAPDANSRTER